MSLVRIPPPIPILVEMVLKVTSWFFFINALNDSQMVLLSIRRRFRISNYFPNQVKRFSNNKCSLGKTDEMKEHMSVITAWRVFKGAALQLTTTTTETEDAKENFISRRGQFHQLIYLQLLRIQILKAIKADWLDFLFCAFGIFALKSCS